MRIKGNVQVGGGGPVSITGGVTIGGNLQVQQLASSTSIDSVCGATINGNLQWQNNRAPVTIGGAWLSGQPGRRQPPGPEQHDAVGLQRPGRDD